MRSFALILTLALLPSCALLRPTATVTWVRHEPVAEMKDSSLAAVTTVLPELAKVAAAAVSPYAAAYLVAGLVTMRAVDHLQVVRGQVVHVSVPVPRGAGLAVRLAEGYPEVIVVQPVVAPGRE
jgi:hypothetical protein